MSIIQIALHDILGWLTPAWDALTRLATTAWHGLERLWRDLHDRHDRLMDTDPRYPVALATGGTAVVKVLITNPAIVNALGVLLADLLDVPENRPPARPTPYRGSSLHGGYGSTDPWPRSQLGARLWDRDDWDDEN
jgi:hypothetical protein